MARRYTQQFKETCLSLYFSSPTAYRNLSKTFILPSRRLLSKMTESVKFQPGFNDNIFKTIALKVSKMSPENKFSLLCLDEMNIKSGLFFNIGNDEIIGFDDKGNGKSFNPALNVLTLMVKGIYNNWKQPLAYFFVNTTCSPNDLKNIIITAINKCNNINLNIIGIVNDMGSSNIKVSNLLHITPERPYFVHHFKKVFYFFDTSHLIKAARNNLMNHEVHFDNKIADWKYIESIYHSEKDNINKLAPKLTKSHIYPLRTEKMKVKLATQVLSHSVSAAINFSVTSGNLSHNALGTAEYILNFDQLFDVFNSSTFVTTKELNKAFTGSDSQIKFLLEMQQFLKKLKFITIQKENGKIIGEKDVTNNIKFVNSWLISISSLIGLWEILKKNNFKFVYTRRISQDCLENFFGSVRKQSGDCITPTPIQFTRAFKKLFTCCFLVHSGAENCADDFSIILTQLKDVNNVSVNNVLNNSTRPSNTDISLSQNDLDFRGGSLTLVCKNIIKYKCGFLIKKCLTKHTCEVCENYSMAHQALDENNLYCYFKAYQNDKSLFGSLRMPNDEFFIFICKLEMLFQENFSDFALKDKILNSFIELFKTESLNHPCENFPIIYLLKLFTRMSIYYAIKTINQNLKNPTNKRKLIIWKH